MFISYNAYSDHELVSLLKDGDHAAYTQVYERYFGLLYLHARKRIRDIGECQDMVQDIFINLWSRREALDVQQGVAPYLYASLRNKIIDRIAHQDVSSRYITSFKQFQEVAHCVTDHRVRENQLAMLIEKEIRSLPPRMREIFELSRKQHLSHREIAHKLDLSEQTVKSQVKHALRILRVRLGFLLYLFLIMRF